LRGDRKEHAGQFTVKSKRQTAFFTKTVRFIKQKLQNIENFKVLYLAQKQLKFL